MISKSVYGTNYEGLTYKERTELINKEIEKRKDQQHKQEIQQKDQEIEKLKQQLAKKDKN